MDSFRFVTLPILHLITIISSQKLKIEAQKRENKEREERQNMAIEIERLLWNTRKGKDNEI